MSACTQCYGFGQVGASGSPSTCPECAGQNHCPGCGGIGGLFIGNANFACLSCGWSLDKAAMVADANRKNEVARRKWEAEKAREKAMEVDVDAARRYIRLCNPADLEELLSRYVNSYSITRKTGTEFATALMRDHRTLQQSMIRYFVSVLVAYGNEVGDWHDGRNEQAASFCRKLAELVKAGTLDSYFPLV